MIEIYFVPPDDSCSTIFQPEMIDRILDLEERRIYNKYQTELKRREFVIGRLLIKSVLSEKYSCLPEQIRIEKGQHGKPESRGSWQFNLSHAVGAVACIFADHRAVGLDIEYMNPANLHLAELICTPDQLRYMRSQPERSIRTFYELWTRKESIIKAGGTGFMMEPNQIEVPLGAEPGIQEQWLFLKTIEIAPSLLLSAVVEQQAHQLEQARIYTLEAAELVRRLLGT